MSEIKVFEKNGGVVVARVIEVITGEGWLVKDPRIVQAYPSKNELGDSKLNIQLLPMVYLPLLKKPEEGFRIEFSNTSYIDITEQINDQLINMYESTEGVKTPEENVEDSKVTDIFS